MSPPKNNATNNNLASAELLKRAGEGDRSALDILLERYVPPFRNWASGRLPSWARSAVDTEDLVQDSVLHLIEQANGFRPQHDGAILGYLRTALKNRIRDRLRSIARRGQAPSRSAEIDHSPLDAVIASEVLERYERALERLRSAERDLIVARVELGLSWQEVAGLTDRPTPGAARLAAGRALRKLAREMANEHADEAP